MDVQSSSTPKPRRTKVPCSFSTPSRIPRMKDLTLTKSTGSFSTPSRIPRLKGSTLSKTFAPVNLFSVSAVFSSTSSPTQERYNFTFVHEGRQQEAVLDKTFLTGLEKDNVRITWEQATMELFRGQEVRVEVTQLKSKAFDQKWLVFGLYFYTIFCLGDGIGTDSSCKLNSDVSGAHSTEDKLNGEKPSSQTLRSALHIENERALLADSPSVQEIDSSRKEEQDGNVSLLDLENSSDASVSVSFGSMSDSESGELGEDFSMLGNPDLSTSHMEDVSVNESVRLPDVGIYFDSLVWKSSIPTDASDIEAQFEKVLEENGLIENYNHLADAFDQIFEECQSNTGISTTPLDNSVLDTTGSSLASKFSPSSPLILGSEASQNSEKKITAKTGPALASTPAVKCGDGDHSLSFGLEGTDNFSPVKFSPVKFSPVKFSPVKLSPVKFSPVKLDSGYYETFSSGSLQVEMCSDSEEGLNPTEKTRAKLPGGVLRQFLFFSLEQIITEFASIM